MSRKFLSFSSTFSAFITLALVITPALAQGFSFGVRPTDLTKGYFTFDAQPGQVIEDSVTLVNQSDTPRVFRFMAVNGTSAATGGLALTFEQSEGVAGWIKIGDVGIKDHQVEIPAQSQMDIPFTIQVPSNTQPGEYVAGFLASPADVSGYSQSLEENGASNQPGSKTLRVQVVPQVGVTVVIKVDVPGNENCQIAIDGIGRDIGYGRWNLALQLHNLGNVHFSGDGTLTVRPVTGGEPVLNREFKVGYFISKDAIAYPFYEEVPPAGVYRVEATVTDENIPACSASFSDEFEISRHDQELAVRQENEFGQGQVSPAPAGWVVPVLVAGVFFMGLAALVLAGVIAFVVISRKRKEA